MEPTKLRELMLRAKSEFTGSIAEKKLRDFDNVTEQDVKLSILRIQKDQESVRTLMNLPRLQDFIDRTSEFQKTLSNVMESADEASRFMSYVWGPLQFLLVVAYNDAPAFDSLLDAYQSLGAAMVRFCNYRFLFSRCQESHESLVHVYQDLFDFHGICMKVFTGKIWSRFFKSSWRDASPTVKYIVSKLELQKNLIESTRYSTESMDIARLRSDFQRELHHYRDRRTDRKRDFEKDERERRSKEKAAALEWLSPVDLSENSHDKYCKDRREYDNLGRWILRDGKIENWISSDDAVPSHSLVWVHAKMGAGKTMLVSLVIEECLKQQDIGVDTYYFYCEKDDPQQNTGLSIFRGLLRQAVHRHEEMVPLCYDKSRENGYTTISNEDVAKRMLLDVFERMPRSFVIIDGLDDCQWPEIKLVLDHFVGAVAKCDAVDPGRLRVLFMSQYMNDMKKMLSTANILDVQEKDTRRDIEYYVKAQSKKFCHNLDQETHKQVVEKTCRNADGVFLYAKLAMQSLIDAVDKAVFLRRCTEYMQPVAFQKFYEDIIKNLEDKHNERDPAIWPKAKELLGWIVAAKRPLTWNELQGIISYNPDEYPDRAVDMDNKMLRGSQDGAGGIDRILKGLVNVIPEHTVRLVHESAREHVINNAHINQHEVLLDLVVICLRYLSLRCFRENLSDNERKEFAKKGFYSFQDYAVSNWIKHIETVIRSGKEMFEGTRRDTYSPKLQHALDEFIRAYPSIRDRTEQTTSQQTDSPPSSQSRQVQVESAEEQCQPFEAYPFHRQLLIVWRHIRDHQSSKFDARNSISIPSLEAALTSNRSALESLSLDAVTVVKDKVRDYYGEKLYKCPRVLCEFFYLGFAAAPDRRRHENRHNRPFACIVEGCAQGPFGFASNKDKDRHIRMYHPDLAEKPPAFVQLTRRATAESARFNCPVPGCNKSFTRNINLKGHVRSHFGERPYACSTCGKSFTRINDCRRHEKIHMKQVK